MRGLIVAVQFLTRLPAPILRDHRGGDLARAAGWLPFVGGIVGGLAGVAVLVGGLASPLIGGVLGVMIWVWVTGALHLDGLADAADGLAAAHGDPKRFLDVARDPATGAFGVVAVVVVLLALFAGLAELATSATLLTVAAVALIAAWARWCALVLAMQLQPLDRGRGASFGPGVTRTLVFGWLAALLVSSLLVQPALVIAPALAVCSVFYWRRRLGGVSGDCHGATIVSVEVALVLAVVIGEAAGVAGFVGSAGGVAR